MVIVSQMGAGAAPTEDYLNQLAQTLSDKPTARGWVCHVCRHTNDPVDNLLAKLPPFKCANPATNCDVNCPGTPEFCISDCVVNKVRIDFLIRDQGPYPTCAGHAVLGGMDCSYRLEGGRRKITLAQPLNGVNLFENYHTELGVNLGMEVGHEAQTSRTPHLLKIAQKYGVEFIAPEGSIATGRVLRVSSWFYISTKGDINYLIRLIASGFPLLASMCNGRCYMMLNDKELYRSPELTVNHAILLIGCTVKPVWLPAEGEDETSKLVEKVIFRARDSKGDRMHVSAEYAGTGGDIYVLAEDLGSHVFGFHLELPHWMQ